MESATILNNPIQYGFVHLIRVEYSNRHKLVKNVCDIPILL